MSNAAPSSAAANGRIACSRFQVGNLRSCRSASRHLTGIGAAGRIERSVRAPQQPDDVLELRVAGERQHIMAAIVEPSGIDQREARPQHRDAPGERFPRGHVRVPAGLLLIAETLDVIARYRDARGFRGSDSA